MTANGYVVFFWGDENVLKLDCGGDVQLCKYNKSHCIVKKKLLAYDSVIFKI